MAMAELKRPLKRRVGNLVVEIDSEGITLRRYRCRKRRRFPWAQIAALDPDQTITGELERRDGLRVLRGLGIVLDSNGGRGVHS